MRRILLAVTVLAPLALTAFCTHAEAPTQAAETATMPEVTHLMTAQRPNPDPQAVKAYEQYRQVIQQTVSMVRDRQAQDLAQRFKLNILDVTWEDTGRYKNSAVGPNISDMTIQVQQLNPRSREYELNLMPVIRHPNFSDESADVRLDRFFLLVGNEKGQGLKRVSLKEFLENPRRYLSQPNSWKGRQTSLLAPRDTHALVSAQACFLPIPQGGKAEFNPVLFNYQSYEGDPAVLTILATRQGTSVTVIDNKRDAFEAGITWGQRLFFNKNGERASLTGQRISDFRTSAEGRDTSQISAEAAGESGLNMVLLIQVPLKQKQPMQFKTGAVPMVGMLLDSASSPARGGSNVEAAVIGHGKVEGPFTEIDNLDIERDPRFPVRVTVQFYKATSNGVVSEKDLQDIDQQIGKVYKNADYVGSLVVSGDTRRPTEYDGPKQEPPGWWDAFWKRYEQNTGQTREEAMRMLRRLRGQNWFPRSEQELRQDVRRIQPRPEE